MYLCTYMVRDSHRGGCNHSITLPPPARVRRYKTCNFNISPIYISPLYPLYPAWRTWFFCARQGTLWVARGVLARNINYPLLLRNKQHPTITSIIDTPNSVGRVRLCTKVEEYSVVLDVAVDCWVTRGIVS